MKNEVEKIQDYLPTSEIVTQVYETLDGGMKGIQTYVERKMKTNRSATFDTYLDENDNIVVEKVKNGDTFSVTIKDENKLSGASAKIFIFLLIYANKHNVYNNELADYWINLTLDDLVNYGIYSSRDSARKGFAKAMDSLQNLKIKADYAHYKHKIQTSIILFQTYRINDNKISIHLNSDISWKALARYYVPFPSYYGKLTSNGSLLLYELCIYMRENLKKLKEQGYVNVKATTIQSWLNLPEGTKNPKKNIWGRIDEAIEDIEECQRKENDISLKLEIVNDQDGMVGQQSYIKVTPVGSMKDNLFSSAKKIIDKKEASIKKNIERKKEREERKEQ